MNRGGHAQKTKRIANPVLVPTGDERRLSFTTVLARGKHHVRPLLHAP